MWDGLMALLTVPAARRMAGGDAANELSGSFACYNVYRCRDGRHVAVGALEPKFWEGLCRALGLPDLVGRQWDKKRQPEVIERLRATFASRERDAWVQELAEADVCVEPILDLDEALAQPQATGSILEQWAGGARFRSVSFPLHLSDTPASLRRPAPRLGEHTAEVLAELGYAAAEVEGLRAQGAVA
jgi:alpha-methylacyl-CoA racemase